MQFLITVKKPPQGVTVAEIKEYIRDALDSWGGGLRLEDPFFKGVQVTVTSIKKEKP